MRIVQPLPSQTAASTQGPVDAIPARRNRFASMDRMAGSQPVWHPRVAQADFAPQTVEPSAGGEISSGVPADRRMGFKDVLDIVNPLQHIPVVSAIYRQMTGDTISPAAQFVGGALYGGPIGAAASMVDIALKDHTGKGFTDNVTALVTDRDNAFKAKTPDIELQTADGKGLNALASASGRNYSFGPEARTAGLMPVWGQNPITVAQTTPAVSPVAEVAQAEAPVPSGLLSGETNFALMLDQLKTANKS